MGSRIPPIELFADSDLLDLSEAQNFRYRPARICLTDKKLADQL
jgi:hypothetical protein